MSTTPNLQIPLIAASQNNKELTANTAFVDLDEALCGNSYVEILQGSGVFTLPLNTYLQNMVIFFTGVLDENEVIILPQNAKLLIVVNETAGSPSFADLIFKTGNGAVEATITDANFHILYNDGVNGVYKLT